MPRNISFALTTEQIRNRTKTVTRRLGWKNLKKGDILNACVKCMGLKKGEKPEKLCQIRVVDVRLEPLNFMESQEGAARFVKDLMDFWNDVDYPKDYGNTEAAKEGFPNLTGSEFVGMFCENMRCEPETEVTRIEFEYLEEK